MTPSPILKTYVGELAEVAEQPAAAALEMPYRAPLQKMLQALLPHLRIIHEGERLRGIGAPDFIATDDSSRLAGCIETKAPGKTAAAADLRGERDNKHQFDKYKNGIANCVFTDYLRFVFCKNGAIVDDIAIARHAPAAPASPPPPAPPPSSPSPKTSPALPPSCKPPSR